MSAAETENQFEPLPMKRRTLLSVDANQYSVHNASGESREIKADTAYEAFIKSGMKDAIKIERLLSLSGDVIEKSKFVDDAPAAAKEERLHDRILRSKSPIISATELDELIRSLQKEAEAAPPLQEQAPIELSPVPVEAAPSFVPQPAPEPAMQDITSSPIGMDVHGDGFDEIIPTAQAAKPAAAKPHAPVEAQKPAPAEEAAPQPAAASDLPPERELSAEEVEKLLGGK